MSTETGAGGGEARRGTETPASGGEVLVRGLEALGVTVVFGLPGVHNLAAWRALAGSDVRLVGVRHEQAAAYAADGFARATGRLGVALTTTGPGAANTLAAVGEAWASGSPVLVVATDIPAALRREGVYRGVLHETVDQAAMFAPVTKATIRVRRADDIAQALRAAAAAALAPPARPVYLEIATDALAAEVAGGIAPSLGAADDGGGPGAATGLATAHGTGPMPVSPTRDPRAIDAAVALLRAARRPLLWAGGGATASQAGPALAALAERLAAPVIVTPRAAGLLGSEHPCAAGLPPQVPEAGELWDGADVVVAVGTDFDGTSTQNWGMPAPRRLIALNVDPEDAAKAYTPDVMLAGDARAGLDALLAGLDRDARDPADGGPVERLPDDTGAPRRNLDALAADLAARRAAARRHIHEDEPAALPFLDATAGALPDDAVVVVDMCIPGYWLGAFHRPARARRLLYPVGWGTLGFAFPAALGAALAGTGPAVSVSGDGGFLFACGELATMAQEEIPLTAVIVDDGGYGMLRYGQEQKGDPIFGVDLQSPDFAALAASFGVESETVDGLGAAFGEALGRRVRSNRPSVLVARAGLKPPPNTSPRWYRRGPAPR